jgi:hypothetical protein
MRRKLEDEASKAAESVKPTPKPTKEPLSKSVMQLRLGITLIAGSFAIGTTAIGVIGGSEGLKMLVGVIGMVAIISMFAVGLVMLISYHADKPT